MKFKELEYKYSTEDIKLNDFIKLMESLSPIRRIDVSSWDRYFSKGEEFIRYRSNESTGELTIKRKTKETNNNNRIEVNLKTGLNSDSTIEEFTKLLGYQDNFKIYKICTIFFFEKINAVYYTILDENMNHKGSFSELECNEDFPWESEDAALECLNEYEKLLAPLGISHQNRMKLSLWERFKK